MATEKQIAANRRNALKSTGPRTARGKARSSQNGLIHGFCSQQIVIPGEDADDFDALHAAYREALQPTDHLEEALIHHMVRAEWRLRRFARAEAGLFGFRRQDSRGGVPPADGTPAATTELMSTYRLGQTLRELAGASLSSLSRYEASARRAYFQALSALEARRQLRSRHPDEPTTQAAPEPPLTLIEPEPIPKTLELPVPVESRASYQGGEGGRGGVAGAGCESVESRTRTCVLPRVIRMIA